MRFWCRQCEKEVDGHNVEELREFWRAVSLYKIKCHGEIWVVHMTDEFLMNLRHVHDYVVPVFETRTQMKNLTMSDLANDLIRCEDVKKRIKQQLKENFDQPRMWGRSPLGNMVSSSSSVVMQTSVWRSSQR